MEKVQIPTINVILCRKILKGNYKINTSTRIFKINSLMGDACNIDFLYGYIAQQTKLTIKLFPLNNV